MKKQRLILNILFICIVVFSIIAFALLIKQCANYFDDYLLYKNELDSWTDEEARDLFYSYMTSYRAEFLKNLFAIIFSVLSAIAGATIAVLYNLPWLKAKKQAQSEELKND